MRAPPNRKLNQKVLRRSVEPTAASRGFHSRR
jgi:hypothetical protein